MKREEAVVKARIYLGVPFVHRGRDARGLDCVGLLWIVFGPLFPIEQEPRDYPPGPTTIQAFREIKKYGRRVWPDESGPGDIALINSGGASTHFGILTDRGIIHADRATGCVIETGTNGMRIVACYRPRGIE